MPRRAATLITPATSTPLTDGTNNQQLDDPFVAEVSLLRRQWKWAAFSQFFYTFANLFALPDISLTDIEDDLTRSTSIVIHRVMHRLLVTATQDRKLSLENWQTALRKQYKKRDPHLNPIGPEPVVQLPTPAPDSPTGPEDEEHKAESVSTPGPSSAHLPMNPHQQANAMEIDDHEFKRDHSMVPSSDMKVNDELKAEPPNVEEIPDPRSEEESKDWLTLSMLMKLDSLHLLTEWQFHNVNRLRTIMRDDDETAQWRIEPIGYDSKANAYWLIGPDRLWTQRAIPKPPRQLKRKRAPTKPKPKRTAAPADDESDVPPTPKKRKAAATARQSTIKVPTVSPSTPTPTTRTRRPPVSPDDLGPITSRSPRVAKTQASAKLSAQAKELAELQRQAALEGRRSWRRVMSPPLSRKVSPRRPTGTRMSARLRGVTQGDDEWQEIPDEWLKGDGEAEVNGGASGNEWMERDEEGEGGRGVRSDPDLGPEQEHAAVPDAGMDTQQAKTGLESGDDAVSDLTELSEISPPATVVAAPSKAARKVAKKGGGSRKKTSQSKGHHTLAAGGAVPVVQPLEADSEEEVEPEWRLPDDFVEWETLCVTLYDWEHICERFEGATHYAEKALYKLLSQHIVPAITVELREIQRKRQVEEAISQRKRSSRLAMKESEKEEARLATLRKAEEEEKLGRMRRLEARLKREEEERLKKEAAREKRRLDREGRERKATVARAEDKANADASIDITGDGLPPRKTPDKALKAKPGRPRTKLVAQANSSTTTSASGSRTPVGEDWVLDCEVCHRTGVNKDDGSPLLCCGKCSRWQHIACHDLADRRAGRPKRDWDTEEFLCRACQGRSVAANGKQVPNGSSSFDMGQTPSPYHQPGFSGQVPYGSNYPPPRSSSYQPRTAVTFAHYQPQQHGFSTTHSSHTTPMIPGHAYAQHHYSAHGTPTKQAQYSTPQHPHSYSNGTNWPAPASPAPSGASWAAHAQTSYATTAAAAAAGAGAGATVQSQPWGGHPYVAPVVGGGGGSSYYSQNPQLQPSQHRAT
ncbi:hypothetical protein B0F90DRAFT_1740819 [Multifurca ochricompacta]|uniref:PHD-type domain-containing protein n=1 Tax=Multifurca ochricompacta TaxID=376703 RepID=A0AAD4QLT4_9AGAM|nr:hypothetical protein B0F90DRAFT_1740819 [Multifurca ochricompacta]